MKRFTVLAALTACIAGPHLMAAAQQSPAAIRLIVPTPAGGPSDNAARVVARALAKATEQTVLVENLPGASGSIAAHALLAANPDGSTLLWGLASMTGIPMLQKRAPYHSLTELTPVSLVGRFAFGIFVHPEVPAQDVAALVDYARSNPEKLNCATGTLGEFMAATQFLKAVGVQATFVPYKGSTQLMPDLISGRMHLNFGPVSSGLQHVKSGRLRMLATLAPARTALAPDVPTLAEAGVKTASLPSWQAIFAPPKTPHDIADRLSRTIASALKDPAVRAQLELLALQVEASTPEALAAVVVQDIEAWRTFIRESGIPQE